MKSLLFNLWPSIQKINPYARDLRALGGGRHVDPAKHGRLMKLVPRLSGVDIPIHSPGDEMPAHRHYVKLNSVSTVLSTVASAAAALQVFKIGAMKPNMESRRGLTGTAALAGFFSVPAFLQAGLLVVNGDDEHYSWFNLDATFFNAVSSLIMAGVALEGTKEICGGKESCLLATATGFGVAINALGATGSAILAIPLFGTKTYHGFSFAATAASSLGTYLAALPSAYTVHDSCRHEGAFACIGDVGSAVGLVIGIAASMTASYGFGEVLV